MVRPSAPEPAPQALSALPFPPLEPARDAARVDASMGRKSPERRSEAPEKAARKVPDRPRASVLGRILRSQSEVTSGLARPETARHFDPALRRALDDKRFQTVTKAPPKPADPWSEPVRELYRDAESATVRIGDKCWIVPVDADSNDRAPQIWMADLNCPRAPLRLSGD